MPDAYKIISSDSHLEVPPERWVHRVPERYRDRAPRRIRLTDGGDALLIEGQPPVKNTSDLYSRVAREDWQPLSISYDGTAGTGPSQQRLREQDIDGIEAEVLFPAQVAGPSLWRNVRDDAIYRALVRAYNDWLAEEYCAVAPERLIGLGVIPWTNVEDAVEELRHCAELGLKGVVLGVFPSGKGYPSPDDDRFWSAALEMRMPLTVHVRLNRTGARANQPLIRYPKEPPELMAELGPDSRRAMINKMAAFGLESATPIAQLVLSGVFDRFPDLKIFFAETRLGWVPFWLESADLGYTRNIGWSERYLGFQPLQRIPSDYIKEHIRWSIQYERMGLELRHHLGVDNIMFATDFPHIECEWPNTRSIVARLYADVPEHERYRMLGANVVDFFGLGQTALGRRITDSAPTAVRSRS